MDVSGKRVQIEKGKCVPCLTEGVSSSSYGYCKGCEECMCQRCFQDHLKAKACRHHVLISLDEKSIPSQDTRQEGKCTKHKEETIKYYCPNHDFVGCGDCMIPDHSSCKPVAIANIAKEFEQTSEFKDIVRKIQHCVDRNNKGKKQIRKSKKINQSSCDSALKEIRKFRKEINSYIDKIELEIICEAEQISKENEIQMAKVERKIATIEKEISEVNDKIDSSVHQGESLFIRVIECKPRLKTIEHMISKLKEMNNITLVVFQSEQKFKNLIESGLKLGRLITNTVEMKTLKAEVVDAVVEPAVAQRLEKNGPLAAEVVKSFNIPRADRVIAQNETNMHFSPAHNHSRKDHQNYEDSGQLSASDPRAAGFDIGKRVYRRKYDGHVCTVYDYGTVHKVYPAGYITVIWEDDKTETRENIRNVSLVVP